MAVSRVYTCKGKGGQYRILATALGAGTSRDHGKIVIYQNIDDQEVYYRTEQDFKERMKEYKDGLQ